MSSEVKLSIKQGFDPVCESLPKPIHYKAAAAYAVRLTRESVSYRGDGVPHFAGLDIYDETSMVVASSNVGWWDVIEGTPIYPAVKYVLAAIQNEKQRLINHALEWLSPTEIEQELDIRAGSVRQYINRHREGLLSRGHIKATDGRTMVMKRGIALNVWKTRRNVHIGDTVEYARVVDIASNHPFLLYQSPLRPELYDTLKDAPGVRVWKTEDGVPYIQTDTYYDGWLGSAIKAIDGVRNNQS